jgi:nucleoside-diphosphate-sugar epimerase
LYVKDTAKGFIAIANSNSLIGKDCNIATQTEITIGELAQELIDQINPGAKIISDEQRLRPQKSEVFRLFGSNQKIRRETNWKPEYNLKQGLEKTIEWFKNPENLKQYKSNIYNI